HITLPLHSFPPRRSSDLGAVDDHLAEADAGHLSQAVPQGHGGGLIIHELDGDPLVEGVAALRGQPVEAAVALLLCCHGVVPGEVDRKSTRLNSSHVKISY